MAQINVRELGALLHARRGNRSLRIVAQEISRKVGKVSASTLSRIEQGKVPDLDTLLVLCQWLNVPVQRLMETPESRKSSASTAVSTPDIVQAHLRADRALDPATAEALAKMVQLVYDAARRGEFKKSKQRR